MLEETTVFCLLLLVDAAAPPPRPSSPSLRCQTEGIPSWEASQAPMEGWGGTRDRSVCSPGEVQGVGAGGEDEVEPPLLRLRPQDASVTCCTAAGRDRVKGDNGRDQR